MSAPGGIRAGGPWTQGWVADGRGRWVQTLPGLGTVTIQETPQGRWALDDLELDVLEDAQRIAWGRACRAASAPEVAP